MIVVAPSDELSVTKDESHYWVWRHTAGKVSILVFSLQHMAECFQWNKHTLGESCHFISTNFIFSQSLKLLLFPQPSDNEIWIFPQVMSNSLGLYFCWSFSCLVRVLDVWFSQERMWSGNVIRKMWASHNQKCSLVSMDTKWSRIVSLNCKTAD